LHSGDQTVLCLHRKRGRVLEELNGAPGMWDRFMKAAELPPGPKRRRVSCWRSRSEEREAVGWGEGARITDNPMTRPPVCHTLEEPNQQGRAESLALVVSTSQRSHHERRGDREGPIAIRRREIERQAAQRSLLAKFLSSERALWNCFLSIRVVEREEIGEQSLSPH
jgi:hypothetical protein